MARTLDMKRTRGRPPSVRSNQAVSSVQSLDRALALLEIVAEADGLTLTDLAQRAGVPPSTAHRILATLQAHEYVSHDEQRGLWLIGVRAFEVGSSFLRNRKLAETGRSIMRELMEECGETVNLAIEDDGRIEYISQAERDKASRAGHRAGSRGAIQAWGVGKALLTARSDDQVRRILHKTGLEKFTPNTLADPESLFTELKESRTRGWAIDNEERMTGMRCVAAPIYNEHGEAFASVSISGPTVRMTDERLGELGPKVRRAAKAITKSIGGRLPDNT